MKIKTICNNKKGIESKVDKDIELRDPSENPLPRIV